MDIFDKYTRYSLAADKQERRKVKDFRITYTRQTPTATDQQKQNNAVT